MADNVNKELNRAGYKYYAFVSYSHSDGKWAKWIQESLENYRLPNIIRRETQRDLPKRIQPVFRDRTDLGAGRLVENLHQELESSRYLVVLCSPNSARPNAEGRNFVNEEVEYFSSLGRDDRIIPIILDGAPGTAFCPKVKELDLLAIDATKDSKARVLNDVVAKLLGLRPDELWRRAERRARIRRRFLLGGVLSLGLALLLGVAYLVSANRTIVECYADMVDDYGLPRGLFLLTDEEVRHRGVHYRFEYRGLRFGKWVHADASNRSLFHAVGAKRMLRKMSVCRSNGNVFCGEQTRTVCTAKRLIGGCNSATFDYDMSGGRVSRIDCWAFAGEGRPERAVGSLLLSNVGSEVNGLNLLRSAGGAKPLFLTSAEMSQFGGGSDVRCGIAQFRIRRDSRGREVERMFLDASGEPLVNAEGAYGVRMELDDEGRVILLWQVDRHGRILAKGGAVGERTSYCNRELRAGTNLDRQTNAVVLADGVATQRFKCDKWGNLTSIDYLDEHGQMIEGDRIELELDEDGDVEKWVHVDAMGKPMVGKDGWLSYSVMRDAYGRVKKLSYLDADGWRDISPKIGYANVAYDYDAEGNEIRRSYGKGYERLMPCKDGYAEVRKTYEKGQLVEWRYFDEQGDPAYEKSIGICGGRLKYGSDENPSSLISLGDDGNPTCDRYGLAEIRLGYDAFGNPTQRSYYDLCGTHTKTVVMEYSPSGMLLSERVLDAHSKPDANSPVVHYSYDEFCRKKSEEYRGVNGELIKGPNGYAMAVFGYDDRGYLNATHYLGVNKKPVLCNEGYAGKRWENDACGRAVKILFLGTEGMPIRLGEGYSEMRKSYDRRGNVMSELYFDADGKPGRDENYISTYRFQYDEYGQRTVQECFDTKGVPKNIGFSGAKVEWEYDQFGNEIEERLTRAPDPYLLKHISKEFRKELSEKEMLILDNGGLHQVRRTEYDRHSRMTEVAYYDAEMKPCVFNGVGWGAKMLKYDARGNVTNISYGRGEWRLPMTNNQGYAVKEMKYDQFSRNVETRYFGLEYGILEKLGPGPDGWTVEKVSYDDHGRIVERRHFDAEERPWADAQGAVAERFEYNAEGDVLRHWMEDAEGRDLGDLASAFEEKSRFVEANARKKLQQNEWRVLLDAFDAAQPNDPVRQDMGKRIRGQDGKGLRWADFEELTKADPADGEVLLMIIQKWREQNYENELVDLERLERYASRAHANGTDGAECVSAELQREILVFPWVKILKTGTLENVVSNIVGKGDVLHLEDAHGTKLVQLAAEVCTLSTLRALEQGGALSWKNDHVDLLAGAVRNVNGTSGAEILKWVSEHGADVTNRIDSRLLCDVRSLGAYEQLIKMGAELKSKDNAVGRHLIFKMALASPFDIRDYGELFQRVCRDIGDVNFTNSVGDTALMTACRSNDSALPVKILLDAGADPDMEKIGKIEDGMTALEQLIHSSRSGSVAEKIRLLARAGVDLNRRSRSKDKLGMTPLMQCLPRYDDAHADAVTALLENGADPNIRFEGESGYGQDQGKSALHFAAEAEDVGYQGKLNEIGRIVRDLVKHGAMVEMEDGNGRTPLCLAVENRNGVEAFVALVELGAKLRAKNDDSLLSKAVSRFWTDRWRYLYLKVDMLLRKGQWFDDPVWSFTEFCRVHPKTPEEIEKCRDLIRKLVSKGCSLDGGMHSWDNGKKKMTLRPILEASNEIFWILVSMGADVMVCDDNNRNALHHACMKYDVAWELTTTPDTSEKWRLEHQAKAQATLERIRFLVKKGVRTDQKDKDGKTPADLVKDPEVKRILAEGQGSDSIRRSR